MNYAYSTTEGKSYQIQNQFQQLAKLTKKYLALPDRSADSEWMFSFLGFKFKIVFNQNFIVLNDCDLIERFFKMLD